MPDSVIAGESPFSGEKGRRGRPGGGVFHQAPTKKANKSTPPTKKNETTNQAHRLHRIVGLGWLLVFSWAGQQPKTKTHTHTQETKQEKQARHIHLLVRDLLLFVCLFLGLGRLNTKFETWGGLDAYLSLRLSRIQLLFKQRRCDVIGLIPYQ